MMRTAILLGTLVAFSALAMPVQAQETIVTPISHQEGDCLVDDDP